MTAGSVIINAYALSLVLREGFVKHNREWINAAGAEGGRLEQKLSDFSQILLDAYSHEDQQSKDSAGDLKSHFNAQDYLHNLAGYHVPQMPEYCTVLRDVLKIIGDPELMIESGFADAKNPFEFSNFVDDFITKRGIIYSVDISQYKTLKSSMPIIIKAQAIKKNM